MDKKYQFLKDLFEFEKPLDVISSLINRVRVKLIKGISDSLHFAVNLSLLRLAHDFL